MIRRFHEDDMSSDLLCHEDGTIACIDERRLYQKNRSTSRTVCRGQIRRGIVGGSCRMLNAG